MRSSWKHHFEKDGLHCTTLHAPHFKIQLTRIKYILEYIIRQLPGTVLDLPGTMLGPK